MNAAPKGLIFEGRNTPVPVLHLRFASGATRVVPAAVNDHGSVLGLSVEGRVVVEYGHGSGNHWTFGLTTCCQATDKGTSHGVVCRGCYGEKPDADTGEYNAQAVDLYVGLNTAAGPR